MRAVNLLSAFVERRFRLRAAYSAALVVEAISAAALIGTFYFLAQLVDTTRVRALGGRAGGYFGYVLMGIALSAMMTRGTRAMSDSVRQGQVAGTLEAVFAAPLRDWEVVGYDGFLGLLLETPRVLAYVTIGALLGLPLGQANPIGFIGVLLLAVLAFWPIGMFGAAVQLLVRRGEPVTYAVSLFSTLVAGVYFPVELLPRPLVWLSATLPLTHVLTATRAMLLEGGGVESFLRHALPLLGFIAVLGPVSALSFGVAARHARKRGALGRY